MTLYHFSQLPFKQRKTLVLLRGRFLATRWQGATEPVHLYLMPEGFFAEMTPSPDPHKASYLFAFEAGSEDDHLADYAMFVKLPDWLPATE